MTPSTTNTAALEVVSQRRYQRGFINVSDGELAGCAVVVAVFFIAVGIGIAVLLPKVWAWFKPILLGWLA